MEIAMKKLILAAAIACLLATPALARTVHLKGQKAEDFIAKYFPDAQIPGPVEGSFTYQKNGHAKTGHATCNVPAMGARSDGAVSECTVKY
jgi:hypothetical protein